MLKVNDSVAFSRTSAAVSLVLGALCFLAANLVDPVWARDERAWLDEIAANPNRYQASALLNALGAAASVLGFIGVLHLLRGRRVTLGQFGAGVMIASWVLVGGHWFLNLVETAGAQVDPSRAMDVLTTAQRSPWGSLVYIAEFCVSLLGPVLLAAGLWTRRATPVWVPVALLLAVGVGFIPANSPPPDTYQWRTSSQAIAVISVALLGAALVGLALRILSLTDEAWARWQPLPDAPRRRRAPGAGEAASSPTDAAPPARPLPGQLGRQ